MVFRVHKTKNFSVICNTCIFDKNLTWKAKGLLVTMLALPDNWNYSISGLAGLSKGKEDIVESAIKELKEAGYLIIRKLMPNETASKRIEYEYNVYEQPQKQAPEKQGLEIQGLEKQGTENPRVLNTNKSITDELSTNEPEKKDISSVPSDISKEKEPVVENPHVDKPKRFSGVNPSIEEVEAYIREKNFHVSAEEIIKYYTNHGEYNAWRFRDGKLVKDWHRCCGTFEDGWKKRNQNRFIETKNRISNDDEDDEIAQMRAFMKTLGGARNAANQ